MVLGFGTSVVDMHGARLRACEFDAGSRNKPNKCFAATGPIRFDLLLRL